MLLPLAKISTELSADGVFHVQDDQCFTTGDCSLDVYGMVLSLLTFCISIKFSSIDLLDSYFREIKNFDSGDSENTSESKREFLDLDFSGLIIRSSRVNNRPDEAEFMLALGIRDLDDSLRSYVAKA